MGECSAKKAVEPVAQVTEPEDKREKVLSGLKRRAYRKKDGELECKIQALILLMRSDNKPRLSRDAIRTALHNEGYSISNEIYLSLMQGVIKAINSPITKSGNRYVYK